MTDAELDDTTIARAPASEAAPVAAEDAAVPAERETPPQYGVGPFSIREVALTAVWLVAFIVSFFPLNIVGGNARPLFGGANVWVSGLSWILTIGLPTIAVFLLVLRRLSPQGIRRFGSLGIDQFASVAFSVAALVWLSSLWDNVAIVIETGFWTRSWVVWVEVILMLAGVVLTVFAPIIPVLEQDFQDRPEIPAHRNARPVRAVVPRPARERPAPAPAPTPVDGDAFQGGPSHDAAFDSRSDETGAYSTGSHDAGTYPPSSYDTGSYAGGAGTSAPVAAVPVSNTGAFDTDVFAPLRDDREPAEHEPAEHEPAEHEPETQEWAAADETVASAAHAAPAQQAFWALVPVERDVVDDYGSPLFRIGPTAWALVIEDRGEVFVVRHEDGRIGYLHDVSGVTRG